jgi:hypothetical protein
LCSGDNAAATCFSPLFVPFLRVKRQMAGYPPDEQKKNLPQNVRF